MVFILIESEATSSNVLFPTNSSEHHEGDENRQYALLLSIQISFLPFHIFLNKTYNKTHLLLFTNKIK